METEYLEINSKIKLAYYSRYVLGSKVGVVIIHGLAEHKGRYKDFIDQLFDNNISVFSIDLRGHGESLGKRGDVKDFRDYLSDVHCFVKYIKDKYPDLKLAFFGHSLGGLIATSYISTYNEIDLLILSSPLLSPPGVSKLFNFIPYKVLGFIKIKKVHSESRKMLEYSKNDDLACHYFTLRLVGVMFKQGINYAKSRYKNIKIPVLMLGGKLDSLVNSGALPEVFEKFESSNKTIRVYDDVKHRIVQNDYKDEIIKGIVEWINNNI